MLNKTDLKLISLTRFKEAEILYEKEKYEGMVHLCVCAIEMALKRKIWSIWGAGFPETTHEFTMFNEIRTHNLQKLLKLSRQEPNMKKNTELWADWSIIQGLKIEVRYSPIGIIEPEEANGIKKATNSLLKFLKIKR
jgi:HEPN domain-containing protein